MTTATDPMVFMARAKLVELEIDGLVAEGKSIAKRQPIDLERLAAIKAEVQVRLDSLREIHREQLAELAAPAPKRKRWWRRG